MTVRVGSQPEQAAKQPSEKAMAALAAMRRAAKKARQRAIETSGAVPTWRDGKIVYDTEV